MLVQQSRARLPDSSPGPTTAHASRTPESPTTKRRARLLPRIWKLPRPHAEKKKKEKKEKATQTRKARKVHAADPNSTGTELDGDVPTTDRRNRLTDTQERCSKEGLGSRGSSIGGVLHQTSNQSNYGRWWFGPTKPNPTGKRKCLVDPPRRPSFFCLLVCVRVCIVPPNTSTGFCADRARPSASVCCLCM